MITIEQKDILNDYAQLKSEIKLLEAKADELNPQVLDIMREAEVEEIEINGTGKLSLGSRRTWKYSVKVENMDKELKDQKKLEERTGKADYTEKKYCIFKGIKEE